MSDKVLNFVEALNEIGRELRAPPGFLTSIIKESDWSLIVKLHALVESAVTYLLWKGLGRPELEPVFSRVELSNNKTGKLAFARELNLLQKHHRFFIRALSEARNFLVHNVAHVDFDISAYISQLGKGKQTEFVRAISCCLTGPIEIAGKSISSETFASDNPKWAIWFSSMALLSEIYVQKELASLSQAYQDLGS
jgi:hypothetical protein